MQLPATVNSSDPTIEFLILAEHVEALNGKLYMMGGAWEQIGVENFQIPITLGLAVGISVPWNATNRPHQVSVAIENADGIRVAGLDGTFNTGRPPQVEHGASQRTLIAANLPLALPGPGTYVVAGSINGIRGPQVTFRAINQTPRGIG